MKGFEDEFKEQETKRTNKQTNNIGQKSRTIGERTLEDRGSNTRKRKRMVHVHTKTRNELEQTGTTWNNTDSAVI